MARPTKYSAEILTQSEAYLENYESLGDVIPSVAGLAVNLRIARTTIYQWAKDDDKEEFAHILADILSKQEQVLFNKGLTNEFNATIVKLALGKHGYSEKTEQEISGPGGGPVQTATSINFIPVTRSK